MLTKYLYYSVFEGVKNIYEGVENIYEGLENIFDALENNFLPNSFTSRYWFPSRHERIDAKIFEIKRACGKDKKQILNYLSDVYNLK